MKEAIFNVLNLPRNRWTNPKKSINVLMIESDIINFKGKFDEGDFRPVLETHPEFIRDWVQFSEDKRTSGWYVLKKSVGVYAVGYLPPLSGKGINEKIFSDEISAVSYFLKQEITDYIDSAVRSMK